MPRVPCSLRRSAPWVLTAAVFVRCAVADDPAMIDIDDVARIDRDRPAPRMAVARRPKGERRVAGGSTFRFYVIEGRIDRHAAFELGELTVEARSDGLVMSTGVAERSIVAGWLAGAKDLLLVAWGEEYGGTGHHAYGNYVVARSNGDGFAVLLRRRGLVGGSTRHIHGGRRGTMHHHFEFDARSLQLITTVRHRNEFCSGSPRPLHHAPAKLGRDAGEVPFSAVIAEEIVHRCDYRNGALEDAAVELYYRTQDGDTLGDIALHYLGSRAPARAVLGANPGVRDALPPDRRGHPDTVRLEAGTRVRIPVHEDWLREFYGL